jgi:hypothetical protein
MKVLENRFLSLSLSSFVSPFLSLSSPFESLSLLCVCVCVCVCGHTLDGR